MARKEIKTINVQPADEESAISVWQTFGWELKNNQEVKIQSENAYLEKDFWGDGINQVTTTHREHYVKLTFERDTSMPNYAELVSLEQQYYALPHPVPPGSGGCTWLIATVIGLCIYVFPGLLVLILWGVWRFTVYSKKYALYEETRDSSNSQRAEIRQRADALLPQ
ncbi:hypothetical protein FACS1894189_8300 [Planctomycetales bacterium]|nr:hypothetical protein FACS1894189_8300 [Planctomycetales bacterium]